MVVLNDPEVAKREGLGIPENDDSPENWSYVECSIRLEEVQYCYRHQKAKDVTVLAFYNGISLFVATPYEKVKKLIEPRVNFFPSGN